MDGCIPFEGYLTRLGYGRLTMGGRSWLAHRLAWMWANGGDPIPPRMCVCHRCDNPTCINPKHLFLGTHQENVADMVAKGRCRTGLANPSARLSDEQVRSLMADYADGMKQADIARRYGVTKQYVCALICGKKKRSGIPPPSIKRPAGVVSANVIRGMAKLSEREVSEIREIYRGGGVRQIDLAARYGVGENAMWKLLAGRTWRHVK